MGDDQSLWMESAQPAAADGNTAPGLPDGRHLLHETDYFLADPGRAQWGPHLERLQAVKRRVDPANLFLVHNGIGNLQA